MPLPDLRFFIPQRVRSADQAQIDQYNQQLEAYQAAYDKYAQQADAYNKAVEEFNKGPRTSPFTQKPPTAPAELSFTQEDLDKFQSQVQRRSALDQANMNRAIRLVQNPESVGNINLAGFSFAQGGVVPYMKQGIGSLFNL